MAAREIVRISGVRLRTIFDRFVAAIDHDLRAAFGGKLVQHGCELLSLGWVAALHIDQEPSLRKGRQHLGECRHQADALAAKRKGLAAVGGIAMADVELLQIGHGVLARDAMAVGAAIQRPVVKHRELAVGGGMNVELDDIGAGRKAGPHRIRSCSPDIRGSAAAFVPRCRCRSSGRVRRSAGQCRDARAGRACPRDGAARRLVLLT